MADFVIPELGENIAGGDVVRVLVKPGDTLKKDQPVLELETDKATIEVPSSVAGVVKELEDQDRRQGHGRAARPDGRRVGRACRRGCQSRAKAEKADKPAASAQGAKPCRAGGRLARRACRGGTARAAKRPRSRRRSSTSAAAPARPAAAASAAAPVPSGGGLVPAAPSTRRTARELGVDITQVPGSGPGGRISVDDVKGYARSVLTGSGGAVARVPSGPLPDFSQWGDVERQPMRDIRRVTAEQLSAAWTTIPHVTQCDKADITELEKLRQKYCESRRRRRAAS